MGATKQISFLVATIIVGSLLVSCTKADKGKQEMENLPATPGKSQEWRDAMLQLVNETKSALGDAEWIVNGGPNSQPCYEGGKYSSYILSVLGPPVPDVTEALSVVTALWKSRGLSVKQEAVANPNDPREYLYGTQNMVRSIGLTIGPAGVSISAESVCSDD